MFGGMTADTTGRERPHPDRSGRSNTRVRYEARLRQLTVHSIQRLTPHMIRIVFRGDFSGFQSLGFDDHVKLFFPDPVTGVLTLPVINGIAPIDAPKPIGRDYTPRAFDSEAGELTIDFAVHMAGPATAWALSARVSDTLHIGGPRGSTLIPAAFEGYVLIGDDTALPAIGRRLAELPLGTPVFAVVEVDGPDDQIAFATLADLTLIWVHRQAKHGPRTLNDAIRGLFLPQNDVHTWVACEASQAKLIREQLIDDHGINPAWLKASGYWRQGETGSHVRFDDDRLS